MKTKMICLLVTLAAFSLPAITSAQQDTKTITLFDGKTLTGWDGDPQFWSVQDGAITGQTTPEKQTDPNTFLIWQGGTVADFQLDCDFRLIGGNSGIQYRSEKKIEPWVIGGYQADFDAAGKYAGILYEERGRGILALPGEKVEIPPGGKKKVIGSVGEADDIRAALKKEQWNHYTIIAKGNHLIHKINGVVTVEVIDNDVDNRSMSGLLALQVHKGPPMTVQFKNMVLTPFHSDTNSDETNGHHGSAIELFNGRDLTGWKIVAEDAPADLFSAQDGILSCKGKPKGYLRSDREFADYKLSVEWRWSAGQGGNNGVLVHCSTPNALNVWPKSIEVQLASGNAGDFWVIGTELDVENEEERVKGRRHLNLTDGAEKPIGQWNKMEITCQDDEVIVYVNGQLVNHATNCSETKGAISLQSEGTPIEFRNIVLQPLE